MNWWRAHHGISNDSKLAVCAIRAKARRCEVLAVWVSLLDYASQNEEDRGSIVGLDDEQIAVMTEITDETVKSIMAEFRRRGMISEEGVLTSWDKRNPQREREDWDAASRKRKSRQMSHHVTPCHTMSHQVTPGHTNENHVTPCHAQIRVEESREEENRTNTNTLRVRQMPRAVDLAENISPRFEEWWTLWSTSRGSNHRIQAAGAWMSVALAETVDELFECTRSYITSRSPGDGGYNPETFLFDQARDEFKARWQPKGRDSPTGRKSTAESMLDRAAELMRQEELNGRF